MHIHVGKKEITGRFIVQCCILIWVSSEIHPQGWLIFMHSAVLIHTSTGYVLNHCHSCTANSSPAVSKPFMIAAKLTRLGLWWSTIQSSQQNPYLPFQRTWYFPTHVWFIKQDSYRISSDILSFTLISKPGVFFQKIITCQQVCCYQYRSTISFFLNP